MSEPYWTDGRVTLYHGDCREVLPVLGVTADCIVADPPYDETSLAWDRWPDGWPQVAASVTRSMWCFGSMRMYLARGDEFRAAGWAFSQDVIWEKNRGSSLRDDRFRRVHEQANHWFTGQWRDVYHQVPRFNATREEIARSGTAPKRVHAGKRDSHLGSVGVLRPWTETGLRLMRSVIKANQTRWSDHPTEKPVGLLDPLITYACPSSGLVVDPFAGSGGTMGGARCSGRRAIGVEIHEPYAEAAARRLSQGTLIA